MRSLGIATVPHVETTCSWAVTMTTSRSSTLGPSSRPVAIPRDLDGSSGSMEEGIIELPIHIWWSEPRRVLDTRLPKDRLRLYELVLVEGNEEDVRRYLRFSVLQDTWTQLFLPRHVRDEWERAFPHVRRI